MAGVPAARLTHSAVSSPLRSPFHPPGDFFSATPQDLPLIPPRPCRVVSVAAPPEESVDAEALRAFVSTGRQGINYRRGTWHMPLISFAAGQKSLIIDRGGSEANCDQHTLDKMILLEAD